VKNLANTDFNKVMKMTADVIRHERRGLSWTLQDLSRKAGGVSKTAIHNMENFNIEKPYYPRLDILLSVLKALGLQPEGLFDGVWFVFQRIHGKNVGQNETETGSDDLKPADNESLQFLFSPRKYANTLSYRNEKPKNE
jgi:transcriptional regulator with XRE-family HTH domain